MDIMARILLHVSSQKQQKGTINDNNNKKHNRNMKVRNNRLLLFSKRTFNFLVDSKLPQQNETQTPQNPRFHGFCAVSIQNVRLKRK